MKKLFLFSALAFMMMPAMAQQTQPKLSPLTRQYLQRLTESSLIKQEPFLAKNEAGQLFASALIKVSDAKLAQAGLDEIGAKVGTRAGAVWTVRVPVEKVTAFSQLKGISYIQLDEPVAPHLNVARTATRVDSVHRGINLNMKYTGKDVVMGVIDFGFDYGHPDFYDTLGTTLRIKKVWELGGTGTPPAGYTYGRELNDTLAMITAGTDNANQTHGTGVAGLASGSGYGSALNGTRLRGIAFESDMVFVGVRRDSIENQWKQGSFTDFLDGIAYIFDYAHSVNKPAVVNISWGSQSGPHDGSTLFNEACDNMSSSGKIIVMSAGNEGEEKIHLSKTFTATDSLLNTSLTFTSPSYKRTWADAWGEEGKTWCAEVSLYRNDTLASSTGFQCIDDLVHNNVLTASNGTDTCFVDFITSLSEYNNKPRMTIDIYNKSTDSVVIRFKSTDGTIHVWNEYYYYGYTKGYQSGFSNGDTATTVSDMGSAESVLLIGAYASKISWTDINRNPWSYSGYVTANKIVPFSSHGPMTDGRVKPDITAPGLTIATACNSYDAAYTPNGGSSSNVVSAFTKPSNNRTYYFSEFTGTSASAPIASGIVALMLQANPYLSASQIRNIWASTAITDAHTGVLPPQGNNTWGHGKINAYGSVQQAVIQTGLYKFYGKKIACSVYPNPNNGAFSIDYTGAQHETLNIEIFNLTGTLVHSQKWNTQNGQNHADLDMAGISKGLYFVRVSGDEGATSIKILVQ